MTESFSTGDPFDDSADRAMEKKIAERGLVNAEEVADMLRRGMIGEAKLELWGNEGRQRIWDECFTRWFQVKIDGNLIVIFNDAGVVDYVELVEWADGRESWYWSWCKRGDRQPFDCLTAEEFDRLKGWLPTIPKTVPPNH